MTPTSLILALSLSATSASPAGAPAEFFAGPAPSAPIVLATWRASQEGNDWFIRNGDQTVEMPDEKTAEKTAKKFNRIEKRAEKKDDFMASEDGPCGDPSSGVRC